MFMPRKALAHGQDSQDRTIYPQGDVSPATPTQAIADTDLGSVALMSPRRPQAPQVKSDNQQLDGVPHSIPLAGSDIFPENVDPTDPARAPNAAGDSTDEQVMLNSSDANDTLLQSPAGAEKHLPTKPLSVKTKNKAILNLTNWWWLEIVSAVFSLACVVGVCAVLLRLDQTPLDQWVNKMHFQPNTLASILMTVAKAALLLPVAECISQLKWIYFQEQTRDLDHVDLFDGASRGPFGALQLLWGLKYRERGRLSRLLAILASIITIVALAIDPFTQRSISFPSRSVPQSNMSASVGKTQIYDTGTIDDGSERNSLPFYTDVGTQGAIFNGIYTLRSPVPFVCPTGECYWDSFVTLGVCAACDDVTQTTPMNCSQFVPPMISLCDYVTPKGFNLSAGYSLSGAGAYQTMINVTASFPGSNDSDPISRIFNLAVITFPTAETNLDNERELEDVASADVWECSLSWCAKQYPESKVVNGTLNAPPPIDVALYALSSEPRPASQFSYLELTTSNGSSIGPVNFILNFYDMLNTGNYLQSLFTTGQVTQNGYFSRPDFVDISYALWKANNMPTTMSAIADSMTNYIRNGQNSTSVYGQAYHPQTFILVHWPWLILPVALTFLALMLLSISIALNRQRHALLWKSSSLPFLFHGLDDTPVGGRELDKLADMEHSAKQMRMKLGRDSADKMQFVKA